MLAVYVHMYRSVRIQVGSQRVTLVYGSSPIINNRTVNSDVSLYSFAGGLMTSTGLMTVVSCENGLEVFWDGGKFALFAL